MSGDGTRRSGNGGGTARGRNGDGTSLGWNGGGTTRSGNRDGMGRGKIAGRTPGRNGDGTPSGGTAGGGGFLGSGRRRGAVPTGRRNGEGAGPGSAAEDGSRERILDAAVAEFADRGYLRASLSRIAGRAGVAKSLVLYYFARKDDLYSAAVDRALQPIEAALEEAAPHLPRDLIERLRRLGAIKLKVYRDRPEAYRLIVRSMVDPAVSSEFRQRLADAAARSRELLYRGVDAGRLRPGVTVEEAVDLLMLVGDGLLPRIFTAIRQRPDLGHAELEHWNRVWERYLELLRDGLYRPSP